MEMKKVRAIERGFYMGIREVGEVFHIPADFAAPWFIPEGFNPPEPDNHVPGDDLGADGLNPMAEGLNPEPQWVEPTPADGVNPTSEVNPENAEKIPENGNISPEKPEGIPEGQTVSPETGKGKRK